MNLKLNKQPKQKTMLINKKYLKQYSPLPSNYDVSNLLPYVTTSEKIWVIPVLGIEMYEELMEQVDGNSLSEENATLLTEGGLWQLIAYATLYEALPFIWTRITEAGIQLGKSDNSDSISLRDMVLIQNHLRAQVEVLKEFVVKFICSHTESYPLMDTKVCPECSCQTCRGNSGLLSPNPYRQIQRGGTKGKEFV